MDTKTFFENFETIANAPGGIARLRELILDLAVRGKLVPQIPEEGDASELLSRFSLSEDRLVEEGIINRPRFQREEKIERVPYILPQSWRWCRIGDLAAVVGGGTPSTSNSSYWSSGDEIPWLTPADMRAQSSKYVMRGSRDITHAGLKESSAQLIPAGSVLFSSRAPIGHVGIAGQSLATNQGFKSCVPYVIEMSEFIYLFLRKAGKEIDAMATGTTFREVSGKQVAQVLIPLPPIQEQKRIVAKVDELMALCDQLELAQQQRDLLRTSARKSAIDSISTASTPEELNAAWKRINQNWTTFADSLESIESLRSLILDLVVQGQLAAQDQSDFSAEDLVAKSTNQATKTLPSIDLSEIPQFEIPKHWVWSNLKTMCVTQTGMTPKILEEDKRETELIQYVTAGDMVKLRAHENNFVPLKTAVRGGRIAPQNSVLFVGIGATIGKSCLIKSPSTFNQQIHSATPRLMNAEYLSLVVASGYFQQICRAKTNATAIPILNKSKWETIPIPVPPLREQALIVVKSRELFALCDELERLLITRNDLELRSSSAIVKGVAT